MKKYILVVLICVIVIFVCILPVYNIFIFEGYQKGYRYNPFYLPIPYKMDINSVEAFPYGFRHLVSEDEFVQSIDEIKKEYEGYNEHILTGKFTATIAITVTFLVYAFMLADYSSKDNYDIQNLSEHYIIPLMVIIDYFMFDKKGTIKWYHPLIWVGCIITYLPYIFIRANIVGNNTYTKYPYFFLNIDELGASEVALWCLGLLVFFTGLSYLVMLFDSKYNKNKNNLEK